MLRFLRSKREPGALNGPPSLGGNRRAYAIGDIHGRLDLLDELIEKIADDDGSRAHNEPTSLIFLGDYVDRGPSSRQVIDYVLRLKQYWPDVSCLMGNHEQVFAMALDGDEQALRFFTRDGVGGRETLLSYGATQEQLDTMTLGELRDWLMNIVPQAHRDFLMSLRDRMVIGDYAFVHAGVRPGIPIEEQDPADLFWIRDEFLSCDEQHSHMVVHGHSISDDVQVCENRIGIDTGAFASGRLTAIGLEGTEQWFLSTRG
jgi:serine/threonine protein phosphatase 1